MRIFEATIGVPDIADALRYFAGFGYSGGPVGRMTAERASDVYGVDSALISMRLRHQETEHGLIRLMQWERPTGSGLGTAPVTSRGSRWIAHYTTDLAHLQFHAQAAQAQGEPIRTVGPLGGMQVQPGFPVKWRAFYDDIPGGQEYLIYQRYFRQMVHSRFFHTLPNYGSVNPESRFRTSEITHVGLIVQGDDTVLDFHTETFGMKPVMRGGVPGPAASLSLLDLPEGETEWYMYLLEARENRYAHYNDTHSGRIIVFRPGDGVKVPDFRGKSDPGCLGMSAYCFRVDDIAECHRRAAANGAERQTDTVYNEFGERSFSFVAPDGYAWLVIER